MPLQRTREPLRPYPRSQASSALRVENDRLKMEVEELRALLTQSRGQVSTLTALLRDTSSSLDLRSQELESSRRSLEEVAADRAEYQRVLSQFQALEAELPEPSSEACFVLVCFLLTDLTRRPFSGPFNSFSYCLCWVGCLQGGGEASKGGTRGAP